MKIALLLAVAASTAHAGETVGSWTLVGADSAIATNLFNDGAWLNTTDAAITEDQAFIGPGIVERGWANVATAATIDFVFDAGVTNNAGFDLVMFDARFGAAEYLVSTDADGFTATLALTLATFTDTGETRDYYFGHTPGSINTASIWGAAFDLSDLGITDGDSVSTIRLTTLDGAADPLGLGRIIPAPGTSLLFASALVPFTRRRR